MPASSPTPSDLIAVAAMIVGFGSVVIMFRVQRELWVQHHHPEWPTWIAWADGLILASVAIAVLLVVAPLLAFPLVSQRREALAAASCVGAIVLQVGYIPAILAHYRIGIGATRTGPRKRGEPLEKAIVVVWSALAALAFGFVFSQRVA